MILHPSDLDDLCSTLADAHTGNKRVESADLSALDNLIEYAPEDMTVTVESGITLDRLQQRLAEHRQWLPIDPPDSEHLTIGELISNNISGPHRYGFGTIREYLIGIRVVLADGRVIKSGGKVVKNVAGYDLCKLFIGSRGSLGIIVEATFKLRPLPGVEKRLQTTCGSLTEAASLLDLILDSELEPVVLDMHNLQDTGNEDPASPIVVIGLAGAQEDVEWQMARADRLCLWEPTSFTYERKFRSEDSGGMPFHLSVLPSRLCDAVAALGDVQYVARAGNGVVWYRGGSKPPTGRIPIELMQRVKDAYDPRHIFPNLPA